MNVDMLNRHLLLAHATMAILSLPAWTKFSRRASGFCRSMLGQGRQRSAQAHVVAFV
jgi:hypothetical protein